MKGGSKMKKYMVFWQRMANSGIITINADSAEEAISILGYNKKFVKMTAILITEKVLTVGCIG